MYIDCTMKNPLVYTAIGGLVLFFWQFLSFAALNLHGSAQSYTPKSAEIIGFLESIDLEHGMYALGAPSPEERSDPGLQEEYLLRTEGKSWGVLNYQPDWTNNMLPNLGRGLFMNVLTALFLFLMLNGMADRSTKRRILVAVAVGWVGYMYFPYSNFIWFKNPDIWAHMIDATVPFALLGWLAPSDD